MGYSPWGHKESDTADRLTLCLFTSQISRSQMRHSRSQMGVTVLSVGLQGSMWAPRLCGHRCPPPVKENRCM